MPFLLLISSHCTFTEFGIVYESQTEPQVPAQRLDPPPPGYDDDDSAESDATWKDCPTPFLACTPPRQGPPSASLTANKLSTNTSRHSQNLFAIQLHPRYTPLVPSSSRSSLSHRFSPRCLEPPSARIRIGSRNQLRVQKTIPTRQNPTLATTKHPPFLLTQFSQFHVPGSRNQTSHQQPHPHQLSSPSRRHYRQFAVLSPSAYSVGCWRELERPAQPVAKPTVVGIGQDTFGAALKECDTRRF
ncbi:hypothetical protein B0T21DRAFT_111405 [Apiosordaria backusii]|uniref:Uncharacterized protein n=1 Tax=Apiosordaria backusii TaxID=314023 RepID=A0AA40DJT3_9PEZI|nr:hypothetical protein B0T21DRAFT_111405 [Apiosordaria backusii]